MQQLRGGTALVTGASGGIGRQIALHLGAEGMDVVASGRREDALAEVVEELRALGVKAEAIPAELAERDQVESLIDRCEQALGPVDVLVNNAGIETIGAFTTFTPDQLSSMVDINLTAPLLLTHRVLPGMLERGRGHVVFISSLAGKWGPAYTGPYAATKASLVGLTQSLRAEHLHTPVGFSVLCPGFVAGDGMYQRMVEEGVSANRMVGKTTLETVAVDVVDAIREDRPEVVRSGSPVQPLLALGQLSPRLAERVVERVGPNEIFRRVAAVRGRLG